MNQFILFYIKKKKPPFFHELKRGGRKIFFFNITRFLILMAMSVPFGVTEDNLFQFVEKQKNP